MVMIDRQSASIYLYQVTTARSTNMISYPNVSVAKQADNIIGFASTVTYWEAPQQVPKGSCGVTAREIEDSFNSDEYLALRELLAWQSEDYNYYAFEPARIETELMVGAMDPNGGGRLPRQNCVFYVNQQGVDPTDPTYARTRAIQFAALMNAANPGGDYHTLSFTDTEDPMLSANLGGNRRNWFRITSAAYTRLCTGRLYLIVEEQPWELRRCTWQIWHDSIWVTHEYPAVIATGTVTQIIEIRLSEVGTALQNSIRYIPHYPYHQKARRSIFFKTKMKAEKNLKFCYSNIQTSNFKPQILTPSSKFFKIQDSDFSYSRLFFVVASFRTSNIHNSHLLPPSRFTPAFFPSPTPPERSNNHINTTFGDIRLYGSTDLQLYHSMMIYHRGGHGYGLYGSMGRYIAVTSLRARPPPRDGDKSEIGECAQIDPAKAADKWANVPEVGGDVPPFKEGICTMHVKEYSNSESGGGGPFDNPNFSFSVEVTLFDNGGAHKIGVLPRTNSPVDMKSKLDTLPTVTAPDNEDFIQFKLGSLEFRNDDGSCTVGGWDHGRDRQMDCSFPCAWNGEALSRDRSIPREKSKNTSEK
ncbi:hypothetical protein C8J57DRAFT_1472755 [Mycena rebaudengoi]|nr:hypothetical protein C8J57DRAFT_1472755 [Mycena rebaudengoi]